jgi:hypothetical protein
MQDERRARAAEMSDPELNPQFRRHWTGPPDLERRSRPLSGKQGAAHGYFSENNCHPDSRNGQSFQRRRADAAAAVGDPEALS